MYSNKQNVNILTALLLKHGVRHAVLCPGNRNAPIVHNLNECGKMKCYAVTDERSAGFFALGIRQATGEKVAVCVTSGSALLNLAPAVAEASLQNQGIIVVSADRPSQWIGQLDGQTLNQPDALAPFVAKHVTLDEPHDDETRWMCNRLANEALAAASRADKPSVHINVRISEPLFEFNVEQLPDERLIRTIVPQVDMKILESTLWQSLSHSRRPMFAIGQMAPSAELDNAIGILSRFFVVICEPLSTNRANSFDDALALIEETQAVPTPYLPDFILHTGGNMVSKRLRHFLRQAKDAECWRVDESEEITDTFMHVSTHLQADPVALLAALARTVSAYTEETLEHFETSTEDFHRLWTKEINKDISHNLLEPQLQYSPSSAVAYFEEQLIDMDYDYHVHYANSTAVRLACRFAEHYVWCNRGVNGIEGSVSTAVGFAAATDDMVFCVVGDLSFFYDQNALWNQNLGGNLRIVLLNNHRGDIFNNFKDARQSAAFDKYILATHNTEARGICTQNDIGYLSAHNTDEMHMGIVSLLTTETQRPMLLECFFD